MRLPRLVLLCLLAAASPAAAQLSPPPGVLRLPPKNARPAPAPVVQAQPAPLTPVDQVVPFDTPQPHPPLVAPPYDPALHPAPKPHGKTAKAKPGSAKAAPVIQPQPNTHAQRAPVAAAAVAATAATAAAVAAAAPAKPPAPPPEAPLAKPSGATGVVTGFALPRWASLRSDEVNLRVGPGTQFPIEWQYHRRELPVQIVDERDVWRQIRDQDGVTGWVHTANLVGHRSFAVKGGQAALRRSAADDATPVAFLKPGVVGRLRGCDAGSGWCEVQVGDYRGYLRREQFYGISPGEAVPN